MLFSEKLMASMTKTLEYYPNQKARAEIINGLKNICDLIESGEAAKRIKAKAGKRIPLPTKINTNSIEITRRVLGIHGPSRSTVNRDIKLKQYIKAREDERLNLAPRGKSNSRVSIRCDRVISKLESFEDRCFLGILIEEGEHAKKELRLLKQQLSKIPALSLTIEELKEGRQVSEQSPAAPAGINISYMESLQALVRRLTDTEELARFDLTFDGYRVKGGVTGNKELVRADELEAIRLLSQPLFK